MFIHYIFVKCKRHPSSSWVDCFSFVCFFSVAFSNTKVTLPLSLPFYSYNTYFLFQSISFSHREDIGTISGNFLDVFLAATIILPISSFNAHTAQKGQDGDQ